MLFAKFSPKPIGLCLITGIDEAVLLPTQLPSKKLPMPAISLERIVLIDQCPVGSTRFTGSPTQYIYTFNPPPPNGLQLSGL